jgi:hypothetical protein
MSWCEANGVDYVLGLGGNQRRRRLIGREMWEASEEWTRSEQRVRVFTEFSSQARKTQRGGGERRVVAKAEHWDGKENPRFGVTSLSERGTAQAL